MKEKVKLTESDYKALEYKDSDYLLNKGAELYKEDTYYKAVEYFRLAASMGNDQAISNLGYCYLYGRDVEQNAELALFYFNLAAKKKNVDALYKLGDIHDSNKWGLENKDLAIYYYQKAMSYIFNYDYDVYDVDCSIELNRYPSLCFALAREYFIGGSLKTDLLMSYTLLLKAKEAYEQELEEGFEPYREPYNKVVKMLKNKEYDSIKEEYERIEEDY